ncbi:MAG: ribosome small subunit-dependent GTPase A [Phormidesmis priestleyi]|uniref:Small ribosomal subunit biogenesis GTPase RsgA n=1 Tax=Phormidesmis priestleyi TaxID=268141 RepID=A0A2W4XJN7_9CYAN|nr:MAG: ribosome small subunit-dependent GTPase A [Phormidesmis priestleyi]
MSFSADKGLSAGDSWVGTVVAIQANYYSVRLDDSPVMLLCIRRALLKKMGQQVMVGDRVTVEQPDWQGERGAIANVYPRQNFLDRPPIANADQILLVFAIAEPTLDPHQLSRFLVKAESTGLAITLCLNKRDLVADTVVQRWQKRLESWGYHPLMVSIRAEAEVHSSLTSALQDKITVVAGPSGVGKSSLTNRLIPDQDLRVNTVSGKLGRGRHTTRHVELFELPTGGFLADTPGFNHPDIVSTPEALSNYFPEIRQRRESGTCQFSNCLHRDEPGCVVRGDWERYQHYLTMLMEVVQQEKVRSHQPDAEAAEKVKMTEDGKRSHEPRLEAKKYRRTSRKTRNQAFQELCVDLSVAGDLEDLEDLEDLGL